MLVIHLGRGRTEDSSISLSFPDVWQPGLRQTQWSLFNSFTQLSTRSLLHNLDLIAVHFKLKLADSRIMGLQMSRVTVSLRHPTAFLQESGAATLKWVGLFEKSSPLRTFFSHLSGEAMVKSPSVEGFWEIWQRFFDCERSNNLTLRPCGQLYSGPYSVVTEDPLQRGSFAG